MHRSSTSRCWRGTWRPILKLASCELADFVATVDWRETPTMDFLVALNRRLSAEIRYIIRWSPAQTPADTLKRAVAPVAIPAGCSSRCRDGSGSRPDLSPAISFQLRLT